MKSFKTEIYTLDVTRLSAIYGNTLKYGTIEGDVICNMDGDSCYRNGEKARVLEINGDDYILESDGKFILTKDELIAAQIKNLENSMNRIPFRMFIGSEQVKTPQNDEQKTAMRIGNNIYTDFSEYDVATKENMKMTGKKTENGVVYYLKIADFTDDFKKNYEKTPKKGVNFFLRDAVKYAGWGWKFQISDDGKTIAFFDTKEDDEVVINKRNVDKLNKDLIAQGYTQDEVKRIISSRSQKKAIEKPIQSKRLIKNGTANYWQDMDEFPIVIYEADEDVEAYRKEVDEDDWSNNYSDEDLKIELENMDYEDAYDNAKWVIDEYDFKTIKVEIEDGYYVGLQLIFSELDGDSLYYYYDEDGNETEEFERDREEDIQKGNELINELVGYGWQKIGVVGRFSNGEAVYTKLDNACGTKKGKKKAIKSEFEEDSDDEVVHMNTAADRQWAEEAELANSRRAITNARGDLGEYDDATEIADVFDAVYLENDKYKNYTADELFEILVDFIKHEGVDVDYWLDTVIQHSVIMDLSGFHDKWVHNNRRVNSHRAKKPITNANTDGIKAQMEYTLESCRDFAENYGDEWDGSDAQAVKIVLDDVVRVKGRDGRIRGNIQEAIADWLAGLPMNIDFENYKILQLGEQWGYLPPVDYNSGDYTSKESKWVDNWFMGIANNILKLARKFKVETPMPAFNSRIAK